MEEGAPEDDVNQMMDRMVIADQNNAESSADCREKIRLILEELRNPARTPEAFLSCVQRVRKMLSIERNPPIQECVDAGLLPILVQGLTSSTPEIQFESAWALTNIASGTSAHTIMVVESGALPRFVDLLSSPNNDVVEQAVWALGNIAGDSPRLRDIVLQQGALESILTAIKDPTSVRQSLLRNSVWTISNCCRGKPKPQFAVVAQSLPVLVALLQSRDDEVLTDACWALSYLSDGENMHIQSVIQAGAVPRVVQMLAHPNAAVVTPALRTLGNIVTGDDMQTAVAINTGCIPALTRLLSHAKRSIRKEANWAFSNITAGNSQQIQAVMDANVFPLLVQSIKNDNFDIAKEALWALSNATSGATPAQIRVLVEQENVLDGLLAPLKDGASAKDARIATVILEGLENVLNVGAQLRAQRITIQHPALPAAAQTPDANPYALLVEAMGFLDFLEALQNHDANEVYERTVAILRRFFESEGGNEEEEN